MMGSKEEWEAEQKKALLGYKTEKAFLGAMSQFAAALVIDLKSHFARRYSSDLGLLFLPDLVTRVAVRDLLSIRVGGNTQYSITWNRQISAWVLSGPFGEINLGYWASDAFYEKEVFKLHEASFSVLHYYQVKIAWPRQEILEASRSIEALRLPSGWQS